MNTTEIDNLYTETPSPEETKILYETRSIEVDEILAAKLPWITRWGITLVGVVMLFFFIIANFIVIGEKSLLQEILIQFKL